MFHSVFLYGLNFVYKNMLCSASRQLKYCYENMLNNHIRPLNRSFMALYRHSEYARTLQSVVYKIVSSDIVEISYGCELIQAASKSLNEFNRRIKWNQSLVFRKMWHDCFAYNEIIWTKTEVAFIECTWGVQLSNFKMLLS